MWEVYFSKNCVARLYCVEYTTYHNITYIRYFVATYLFLLWYDRSSCRCFVLLLEEIQFLSKGFLFLPRPIFLVWNVASLSCFSFSLSFLVIFPACPRVVNMVSAGCNQSSSVLFYVAFRLLLSMPRRYFPCWQVLFIFFSSHILSLNIYKLLHGH